MSKFINFGAGWRKESKNGNEFLSFVVKNKDKEEYVDTNLKTKEKTRTRLWLQVDDNEPEQIGSFCVFSTNKEDGAKGPDYRLTFIKDEG